MYKSFMFAILSLSQLLLLLLLNIGCAQDKKSSPPPSPPINAACPVGQVQHVTYGCIPQGNCPSGYGYYNNSQCVPLNSQSQGNCGVGQIYTNQGCAPTAGCPANQGMVNNVCAPGNVASLPVGGGSNYQYGAGSCNPGQIYTFYGCAPTAGCPPNQGMYNYNCHPALTIGGNGPLGGYYGSGNNSYYNSYYNSNTANYPNNYYYGGYTYPYYYGNSYYYGYPHQRRPLFNFYLNF